MMFLVVSASITFAQSRTVALPEMEYDRLAEVSAKDHPSTDQKVMVAQAASESR